MPNEVSIVWDTETVPDKERIKQCFYPEEDISPDEAYDKHITTLQEQGKSTFLKLEFHRIVALSMLIQDDMDDAAPDLILTTLSTEKLTEPQILAAFHKQLSSHTPKPRMVTFNGRGFDVPLIAMRALVNQVPIPLLFETGTRDRSFSYHNNYIYRYSDGKHLDVMDKIALFRYSSAPSLHSLAEACSIPGKIGIDGSGVAELTEQGRHKEVQEYCEHDVFSTALLYYRIQLITGSINKDEHDRRVKVLLQTAEEYNHDKYIVAYHQRNGGAH